MDVRTARTVTFGLAGISGVLLLSAMIQLAGYGTGYGWLSADVEQGQAVAGEIDQTPIKIPALSNFAEVENRPLFNEDRKPTPLDEDGAEVDAAPAVPLNVTLTGVIIVRETESTSELRIAMVRDNMRNESLALKVGMPLSGDQAGWTLVTVEPRLATFRNASDETAEIELNTAANAAKAPMQRPPVAAAPAVPPGREALPRDKGNGADSDLARRIEERRRQMREEAERLRSQRGNSPTEQKN
jgi:general secretion pathway protein N